MSMKSKKTVAVIGCSFSKWHNSSVKNWPQHFSRLAPQCNVYNFSQYINSNSLQYLQARHILENKNYNVLILQWTTFGRITFLKQEEKMLETLLHKRLEKKEQNYYEYPDCNYYGFDDFGVMHINPGSIDRVSKKYRNVVEKMWTEAVGTNGFGSGELREAMQHHIQHLAKKNNKALLQFQWLDDTSQDQEVDFIVDNVYPLKEYSIDEGFHFGNKGNILLSEYINKKVSPLL